MSTRLAVAPPKPLSLPDGGPAAGAWSLAPDLLHLNHGSFGAVPLAAQREQDRLRERAERAPVVWFPAQPQRIAAAREALAAFLRVSVDDLALVPNASAGVSTVLASLTLAPGAEILVTDHGYGAVTMAARRAALRCGGRVRTAHVPLAAEADEAFEAIAEQIGDTTGLILLDQITSATGRLLPVGRVAELARERGIPFLVDGAHAPGMLAAPLDGLDCDFWTGNLHKFGCTPRGTSALVVRGPLREGLYPLIDSWGGELPFPARFDHTGTQDTSAWLAAPTALSFVERTWGWDTVRGYLGALVDYGQHVVAEAFARHSGQDARAEVGTPAPALRLVRLPDTLGPDRFPSDVLRDRAAAELGAETAFTSFDGVAYLRLSAHVYNTPADYEEFAERCVPALLAWSRAD
ncbi:aminotransferase class V-fold PLP-dependent enzyme [Streptomyces sp. VRA16 Mangrove soil]|uniref:aminotransferase class V-fold PLP-dependent enzyme n=1 Tax=Streptomyces sp. VRA16 Mangrove soil TaxID=2817434 RepID=UPI001A9FB039|nr:aminotransferase class V-fold PLP-dependent enzyme [Streptomyces sp. VRA16 Mangrove soil]MBO1329778.1 aminotransferase class V-fold PLP-dependent enzyme [Streptomyces sp. VRA16 Mangrove soil]